LHIPKLELLLLFKEAPIFSFLLQKAKDYGAPGRLLPREAGVERFLRQARAWEWSDIDPTGCRCAVVHGSRGWVFFADTMDLSASDVRFRDAGFDDALSGGALSLHDGGKD
jgi:hypothetical protein